MSFALKKLFCLLVVLFLSVGGESQITNYVTNGGLDKNQTCLLSDPKATYVRNAIGWSGIGTYNADRYCHYCTGFVPNNGFFRNYPRSDSAYVAFDVLCLTCGNLSNRTYVRNTLKSILTPGKIYCVKFYINLSEWSYFGIDKIGAYFGDSTLDTITKGQIPLTYLNPQILTNIFPTDTIGWTLISGTFTAIGNEKYMLIGNFHSDQATSTIVSNTLQAAQQNSACEIALDDVSCIPLDLPAFAGKDTTCIPGTTIYLGRPRDVGIDEDCMWYKLPVIITPTTPAIDTAAGIWVSPMQTSTYVVKQDICGVIKFDTVIVYKDAVGLEKSNLLKTRLKLLPQPSNENVLVSIERETLGQQFQFIEILDNQSKLIRRIPISSTKAEVLIETSDLAAGIYFLKLVDGESGQVITSKMAVWR